MSKPVCASLLLLTCLLAAQAPVPAVVPVAQEPMHHLVFENEYVRVFQVEVAPHAATLMHRHDKDYVFVTLGDSEVISELQGEKPVALKLKDGEARFTKGGFAHIAKNVADKPFRNVTVEILKPESTATPSAGHGVSAGVAGGVNGATWGDIARFDEFAVREFSIPPGTSLSKHEHKGPHLVIAVSNLLLRNDLQGKEPGQINQAAGNVKWIPGGFTHAVTNVGEQPARFVTIEFK